VFLAVTTVSSGNELSVYGISLTIVTGGGRLSCVAQANLECDANVIERGKDLCRAKAANGLFDGGNIIQNLSQASVN
jgi:hypothetical protein